MGQCEGEARRIAGQLTAMTSKITAMQAKIADTIGNTATGKDREMVQMLATATTELNRTAQMLQQIRD